MARVASLLVLVSTLALVAAATAGAGRPPFNPVCTGTKIEPVVTGTFAVPFDTAAGTVTITVRETAAGDLFDFQTDTPGHVVTSIGVKGGPAYETWEPGTFAGTDLHAAFNPNSGKWYGLSYLCFATSDATGGGGGEL